MFCCRKLYTASADRGPRTQVLQASRKRNDQVRKRPGLSNFIPFPFVAEIPTRKSMERGSRGDGWAGGRSRNIWYQGRWRGMEEMIDETVERRVVRL